ncbi:MULTISPECIES: Zn-ribbon domain-containing OB-fold protein [Microvirga]|uniref:Zn-ribbon domain-containing OB-fold protein n=1 Tax=Microvirga TaxID=186650 RepID=UPI001CFEA04A|nr:zinc ribbon domain-containing protein [Microvirga lenta]MCB5174628.1 OB-fold domain-containing protein [Microvirga lenta]
MSTDPRFDGPGPDEVWRTALAEGRLLLQHCRDCEATRFPPAMVCGACGSPDLEWREASGRGVVHASTTVREREGGYNVSLIDLAEGARMMSRVENVDSGAVRIGMEVVARIVPEPEPFVVFDPAEGGAA